MKDRKPQLKRVLLRSGVFEDEAQVGAIFLDLRAISLNHPKTLLELYALAAGQGGCCLSSEASMVATRYRFLDENSRLYDDVKDVILSGVVVSKDGKSRGVKLRDPRAETQLP